MPKEILEYVKSQRVGVLAVEMPDGSPHGATVHFANTDGPFQFFFETDKEYRKSEALFGREFSRATFVIGCDESNMKTLQMDGQVRLVNSLEEKNIKNTYLVKFPEKAKKSEDSNAVFFTFIPTWWRFTDWTGPEGKKILVSDIK